MTPRQFAALLGCLTAIAGLIFLMLPLSGDYDASLFGDQSVDCGSALVTDMDMYSNDPLEACKTAVSARRAWAWPVFIAGSVMLAGAVVVRTRSQSATPGGTDTSP